MKKQLHKIRRFFSRAGAKKLNATAAREAIPGTYDDDTDTRLSGAFVAVLLLHVVALAGVFAFSRISEGNKLTMPAATPAPPKTPAKSPAKNPTPPPVAVAPQQPAPEAELPPLPPPQPVKVGRNYIVKAGDNLTRIAVAFNLRPTDLVVANNLKSTEITPGQELAIPEEKPKAPEQKPVAITAPKKETKPAPDYYIVRKNDTLVKISRDLGVKYEDMTKLNGIKDPKKLQEGQKLKVPKK